MKNDDPMPAAPLMSERRTAVIGAVLTAIGPVSMAIYTPAMPALVDAFGTTESAIKMSLSLYFAGFAIAQLVSGPMSDAFGRRAASVAFLAIFMAGSLLCAFAPSVELLLAARLVQGIGASVGITVARAVVRDQFTGRKAAGIMNLIGIMLAIGPAAGPTIGGLALAAFGWQAVFALMILFGAFALWTVIFLLRETSVPDPSRARPSQLLLAAREILANPAFLFAAMIVSGGVGALYAQSTMLAFVLIRVVGLTPTEFGVGMLMQTGAYFLGSVALRQVAPRIGDRRAAIVGLCFSGTGGVMITLSVFLLPTSYLSIMLPVALTTFGIAFFSPYIVTAAMAPFPATAGSASAILGFLQMTAGFLGGAAAAMIGSPLIAFGIIIPVMEFMAVAGWIGFAYVTRGKARST